MSSIEKKWIPAPCPNVRRGQRQPLLNLNIADKVPDFKGIYHVMVRSVKNYWVRDRRFVSLSDIGLIAKEGHEKMLVFANSIKTASPIPE